MSGLLFATTAWHPAAERISECLMYIESRMNVKNIAVYCDALDTICIIPFSCPDKHMGDLKERKYISWARREADIRLRIDFNAFIKAPIEIQRTMVKDVVIRSLHIIKSKCEARKLRFDLDEMLQDIFSKEDNQV